MKTLKPVLATFAAATWILGAGSAVAQDAGDDEINPDRPGIAESSHVVPKGRLQVEAAFQHETRREADVRTRTQFVPALLRIGVLERVELRIEGDTYTREKVSQAGMATERSEGMAPTSLGVKVRLAEGLGSEQASVAAIARFFPRSGSGSFRSAHRTGDLRLAADWELAPRWSFNPNIGVGAYEDDSQRRYTTGLLAATLSYEPTTALALFIDSGLRLREQLHGKVGALVDVGATYRLGRDTQLDASAGWRVAGATFPRRMVSVGFSRRF
jgi:hypothetical protein